MGDERRARSVVAARVIAIVSGATFLLGSAAGAAYGTAVSSNRHFTAGGVDWGNFSKIYTSTPPSHINLASSAVWSEHGAVPAGYLGVQPMKRDGSGNVVCTGTWSYSTSSGTSYEGFDCLGTMSATYSSQGLTVVWTGSSYASFWTNLSPNQTS